MSFVMIAYALTCPIRAGYILWCPSIFVRMSRYITIDPDSSVACFSIIGETPFICMVPLLMRPSFSSLLT